MFKSKFTHREYALYLKSELEDIILTAPEEKTSSTNLDMILRSKPEPLIQELTPNYNHHHYNSSFNPLLPKVIPQLKWAYLCIVPLHTSLVELWNKLPAPLALQIVSFLPIKTALNFAGTCKALDGLLKHKIYVQKLEKYLNITLDFNSKNHLLGSTAFLRSFYKSLYFTLAPESVFSTKTMLQEKNSSAIPSLARDLFDFCTITNTKTLQILQKTWRKLWSPVIMLSSTSGRVTLWTAFQSYNSSSLHILFDHRVLNSQSIISLRLFSADFLVIQTREKTTIPGFAFIDEFAIININKWVEAMDGKEFCNISLSVKDFDHSFQVAYKTNPTGDDFTQDEKFSQYLVCHESGENIPFFYVKESENKTILSVSNLILKKLEKPLFASDSDNYLPKLVPSEEGKLLVLSEDFKIKVLTYDQAENTYLTRNLHYSGKVFDNHHSANESFCYQKYQFGSFMGQKGNLVPYLLILKNNEFFFINTNSLMSRKSLTIIPENGSIMPRWCDKDAYGTIILSRSVTSWHAYDDKIAMALNNTHLVVFQISSEGEFTKISAEKQLLLGQSKWESRSQAQSDFIEKPAKYAQELERSKLPLYIFINNSYLVIVSFPTVSQSFCIYFASLPEILLSKIPEIWTSKIGSNLPALNIQRTKWEVSSQDIFYQDPKSFFRDCNKHENYHELMKFEDNKLLLRLGTLNLYFDFECLYNFDKIPFPNRLRQEGSQTLQIDLPNNLRLHKTDEVLENHVQAYSAAVEKKKPTPKAKHKQKEPEPQIQTLLEERLPYRQKKGMKHQHYEDLSSEEDEQKIQSSQTQRQRRKKEFQEFKNAEWFEKRYKSSSLRHLHHNVDLKEQFLKLINQRKDKHKDKKRHDSF